MLKCHNLLVRLFQNGTGGHQVISKNQVCQEICCHVLTCAHSTTAACQSENSLLGISQRVSTRHQAALHVCQSRQSPKPDLFARFFPAALIARNALLIRFLYHHLLQHTGAVSPSIYLYVHQEFQRTRRNMF